MKISTLMKATLSAATLVLALGACSKSGARTTTGQYIDDATVTAKVKAELVKDEMVKATEVKVETTDGVVQLAGFVATDAARQHAGEVAQAIAGVKSVRNDLVVQASKASAGSYINDAAITTKVKAALIADDEVKGLQIGVETSAGTVQLTGHAKTDSERHKAEQLAKAVEGVSAVQNNIALN